MAAGFKNRDQSEQIPGKRPNIYGKFKEIAEMRFGNYELRVESPHEAPPLGLARLSWLGGTAEGPLDTMTWRKFGDIIRQRETPERMAANG